VAAAKPDVLFVSAYLDDAIALRRQLVRQHVPLVANIGTSSSYCMPAFGATLGKDAVGVYASDKPSATSIDPTGLLPDGAALLERANDAYRERWNEDMSPAALAGFSAAWALFTDVLPRATSMSAAAVADAARTSDIPAGSLPNGSGLRFGSCRWAFARRPRTSTSRRNAFTWSRSTCAHGRTARDRPRQVSCMCRSISTRSIRPLRPASRIASPAASACGRS